MFLSRSAFVECLAAFALLAMGSAAAQDAAEWQPRQTDESSGAAVATRERSDGLTEFRATVRSNARLSSLVAALLDIDRMPAWVYRVRSVTRIESLGDSEGVDRVVLGMPWPFKDREALVHWTLEQDPATLAVTLRGSAVPDKLPRNDAFVRMPTFESQWRFTPAADGTVAIEFEGHGNPGGSLASPLLRAFVASAIWQGLRALQAAVAQPPLRSAVVTFIREPAP
jgi:hypothetical protein